MLQLEKTNIFEIEAHLTNSNAYFGRHGLRVKGVGAEVGAKWQCAWLAVRRISALLSLMRRAIGEGV